MAGAGYKLFATGDVLTAAQVNTYLNEQTVMVFADSAARTTALTSVLAEGMMSYLQDTNAVEVYNGSAWVAVGGGGLTSPLTTKGDIWVYGTGDTRLPVGTDGHTLVADSAQTTGLKWAAAGGGTWTSAASGSLSGSSLAVTGLSGKKYIILIQSASHNGAPGYTNYILRFNNDSASNYVAVGQNGTQSGIFSDSINGSRVLNMIFVVDAADATTTPKPVWILASGIKNPDGSDAYFGEMGGIYKGTSAITQINFSLGSNSFDSGTYEIWSLS